MGQDRGGSFTESEIDSQPALWQSMLADRERVSRARELLVAPGERVLFIGCGTSAFMAQSLAILREEAGLGESHRAYGSEHPPASRSYDRVIALTRSGTTTEILEALSRFRGLARTVAVCAVPGMPVEDLCDDVLVLEEADEQSVVQTRFPTSLLVLARAAFAGEGDEVSRRLAELPGELEAALSSPIPNVALFDHYVYLGRGWAQGLATEAALKIREAAQAWAESYPSLDYRHGPIAVAGERTLVFIFDPVPEGLVSDVEAVGATVWSSSEDPLVQLVCAQRIAVALARHRGLDPDHPRHLTRSIILAEG